MQTQKREKIIHEVFTFGVLLKGLNAVLEIIGGIVFYFGGDKLILFVQELIQSELLEEPQDPLASYLKKYISTITASTELFVLIYLLSHGIIKLLLIMGLLRSKLWAYPSSIVVFALFVIYQIYRYSYTYSPFLIILSIFDIILIWLTWHEYNYYKKYHLFR